MERTFRLKVVFATAYVAGFVTAGLVAALLVLAGPQTRPGRNDLAPLFRRGEAAAVTISEDLLEELKHLHGVIENAGNPTEQPPHDTILTRPDPDLGYVLRPGAKVNVHTLRSDLPLNFDPPALHLSSRSPVSPALAAYIRRTSQLSYTYTINDEGRRITVPRVASDDLILIVGDSVAFGVGVGDADTLASCLQREFGDKRRVLNAAVGGYNGRQCVLAALRWSHGRTCRALVYVACQNDFGYSAEEAREVLSKLAELRGPFPDGIVVVFQTYMEYCMQDMFGDVGMTPRRRADTDGLRTAVREACARHGFTYVDWAGLVQDHMTRERSPLARFGLYVDHVHLSPLGNRLLAKKLFRALRLRK